MSVGCLEGGGGALAAAVAENAVEVQGVEIPAHLGCAALVHANRMAPLRFNSGRHLLVSSCGVTRKEIFSLALGLLSISA